MSLLSRLLRRWGYVKLADYGLQLRDDRVVPLAPGLSPGQGAAPAPQGALPPGPPPQQPGMAPWPGQGPGAPWPGPPAPAPWPHSGAPAHGAAPWPAGGPQPGPAAAPAPFAEPPAPFADAPASFADAPAPSPGAPPAHARGPLPPVPSAELTPPETAALDDPRFEDTMSFLTVDGEEPAGRDAADAALRKASAAGALSPASPSRRPAPQPAPGAVASLPRASAGAPAPKPRAGSPAPAPAAAGSSAPSRAAAPAPSPRPAADARRPAPAPAPQRARAGAAADAGPPRPETDAEATRAARPMRPPAGALAASVGEVGARLADDSDDATVLESHPAGAHFFAAKTTAARPPAPRQIPTVIAADLASGTPLPGAGAAGAESTAPDDTDVSRRGD